MAKLDRSHYEQKNMHQSSQIPRDLASGLIRSLIRPLVRVALRALMPHQEFADLVRAEYARLGYEATHEHGSRLNLSRISVVTGIHRRDIKKSLDSLVEAPRQHVGVITKLIKIWSSNPRFVSPQGDPKPLTFKGSNNGFRKLMRRVSVSVDAGAVLKELRRLNQIREEQDVVLLQSDQKGFPNTHNVSSVSGFLEQELQTLLDASLDNLAAQRPENASHSILRTYFDTVPAANAEEVSSWLRNRTESLHQEVRAYLERFEPDTEGQAASSRPPSRSTEVHLSTLAFTGPNT
jgi:hypothetical protein